MQSTLTVWSRPASVTTEPDPVAPANPDGSPAQLNPVTPPPYDVVPSPQPEATGTTPPAPAAPVAAAPKFVPDPPSAVPMMGFRPMRGQTAPAL